MSFYSEDSTITPVIVIVYRHRPRHRHSLTLQGEDGGNFFLTPYYQELRTVNADS